MVWAKKIKPILLILLLIGFGFTVYLFTSSSSEVSQITDQFEANDAIAAVLYSTSLVGEYDNDGISILSFIDSKGKLHSYETTGLESNALIINDSQYVLHEKNQVTTFTPDQPLDHEILDACTVYTGYGQSNGRLEALDTHYSLFNQRFSDDSTYYISTLRWGNNSQTYCTDINEYILTEGHSADTLYILSTDIFEQKSLFLVELEINAGEIKETKTLLSEQRTEDLLVFTKLIIDQDHQFAYFIYSDLMDNKVVLNLSQIDLQEKKLVRDYILKEYSLEDDPDYFLYNKEAIQLIGDRLYYADGFGDVYAFELDTKILKRQFTFENYERQQHDNDEMLDFQQNSIFFFRFDENKNIHLLEEYLYNGEKLETVEISGLKELVRNKRVYLYDFKILSED